MTKENIVMIYYIGGILYVLFNAIVRKIETDDNPMVPFSWFLLWPIFLVTLIGRTIYRGYKKYVL